ncbi:MAG: hypothetical protein AAB692_05440 [Patescibacteria group bacterium]
MNPRTTFALIDTPSAESQGMLGIFYLRDGAYYVGGHAGGVRLTRPIDGTPDGLLKMGAILRVPDLEIPDHLVNPTAHWIGDAFREKCRAIGGPALPDPAGWTEAKGGKFSLDEPTVVFGRIDKWLRAAALQAFARTSWTGHLVSLMNWTRPDHEATRALAWHAAGSDEARRRELRWQCRCWQIAEPELEAAHKKFINDLAKASDMPEPYGGGT